MKCICVCCFAIFDPCGSLTLLNRVPSPVVPVPGVGQVGQGLHNTWGLDEEGEEEEGEDEEEEIDNHSEEREEEVTKMEEENEAG